MNNIRAKVYAYRMNDASKNFKKIQRVVWESLRSPKLLSFLKLAGAVVGVVHAIDELSSAPRAPKSQIGFKPQPGPEIEEDEENDEYEW